MRDQTQDAQQQQAASRMTTEASSSRSLVPDEDRCRAAEGPKQRKQALQARLRDSRQHLYSYMQHPVCRASDRPSHDLLRRGFDDGFRSRMTGHFSLSTSLLRMRVWMRRNPYADPVRRRRGCATVVRCRPGGQADPGCEPVSGKDLAKACRRSAIV